MPANKQNRSWSSTFSENFGLLFGKVDNRAKMTIFRKKSVVIFPKKVAGNTAKEQSKFCEPLLLSGMRDFYVDSLKTIQPFLAAKQ